MGLRSAIAYLYKEGRLFVVNEMSSKDGKTKELAKRLTDFGLSKALLIDGDKNEMFARCNPTIYPNFVTILWPASMFMTC